MNRIYLIAQAHADKWLFLPTVHSARRAGLATGLKNACNALNRSLLQGFVEEEARVYFIMEPKGARCAFVWEADSGGIFVSCDFEIPELWPCCVLRGLHRSRSKERQAVVKLAA